MPKVISPKVRDHLLECLDRQVDLVKDLELECNNNYSHFSKLRAARRRLQHLCARLGHCSVRIVNDIIKCEYCLAQCPVDKRNSDFPLDIKLLPSVDTRVSRWFSLRA